MHFADLDLWLFPRSYTFQGQLSCSVTNVSGRELRYVWHWIWEVMRKEFLQKKQVEKSVFFSVWYGEEEGFREYSREERHCVPLHTRPPRIALVSNPAPALLLMARPGFRKAGFFSNREKLPQTRFFLFPFPFLLFPSLPPSFSDKLVDQHCVKKGYHWNTTSTELAGITKQTCKRDSPSTTALPISYLSHEELKKEKKVETTIIVHWDHTK